MKIAVIAVTKQGIEQGEMVQNALLSEGHKVMFYVPGKYSLLKLPDTRLPFRKPLKEVMGDLMENYEAIVCIMALGIVVRLIAPRLKDKKLDPAVVVMDEMGQNVISVLSGHWGGANRLTTQLASALAANPVITTATDVRGLPAIEMIAKDMGWGVEPFPLVRKVNAAIVNTEQIEFYCDNCPDLEMPSNVNCLRLDSYNARDCSETVKVVVTNRVLSGDPQNTLFLRPKNLILGIGCRKGVTKDQIREAVTEGLSKSNLSFESIREMASIDIKAEEPSLLELAEEWNLPLRFFTASEISNVFSKPGMEGLDRSELVKERIGVDGVCEPVALLATDQRGNLILPKLAVNGVTVAIAEVV